MTVYAIFDALGHPLSFLDTRIHHNIPESAIPITDEQHREFLEHQGRRCWVDGDVVEYTPPGLTPEEAEEAAWTALRTERGARLARCDWTQVADAPVDSEAWAIYRQALRDLPQNTTDPSNPEWPNEP